MWLQNLLFFKGEIAPSTPLVAAGLFQTLDSFIELQESLTKEKEESERHERRRREKNRAQVHAGHAKRLGKLQLLILEILRLSRTLYLAGSRTKTAHIVTELVLARSKNQDFSSSKKPTLAAECMQQLFPEDDIVIAKIGGKSSSEPWQVGNIGGKSNHKRVFFCLVQCLPCFTRSSKLLSFLGKLD